MIEVEIIANEYWVKVVDFLQQNWAVIEDKEGKIAILFINDASGVFDKMEYSTVSEAVEVLMRNGFQKYTECGKIREFITPPQKPFFDAPWKIYSSGLHWT